MKKIFVLAVATMLIGGAANAQMAKKQPAMPAAVVAGKSASSSKSVAKTASVTPRKTTGPAATGKPKSAAIVRKHHHKARKPKVKKG